MLIALFAVLGVDLVVIVVLVAAVLARKRWVSDEPGAFRGAIRITGGEVPGLGTRRMRGYGRWVREILVWMKAPFLFRSELVVADAAAGAARAAKPGEVRGVGKHAAIVVLAVGGGARIEVAASADGRERAAGPFAVGGPVR
ncbi:MAG TPA: hypothetical protein VF256_11410 [Streptosporangiaceae bacterium]